MMLMKQKLCMLLSLLSIICVAEASDLHQVLTSFCSVNLVYQSQPLTLTNSHGESTDSIIYQDTIYVPLRSFANQLDKNVSWNQAENTVSIEDADILSIQYGYDYGFTGWAAFISDDGSELEYGTSMGEPFSRDLENFSTSVTEYTLTYPRYYEPYTISCESNFANRRHIAIKQASVESPTAEIHIYAGDHIAKSYVIHFERKSEEAWKKDSPDCEKIYWTRTNIGRILFYDEKDQPHFIPSNVFFPVLESLDQQGIEGKAMIDAVMESINHGFLKQYVS